MLRTRAAAVLLRQLGLQQQRITPTCAVYFSEASLFATRAPETKPVVDDDETFELLPPGCSMVDPTYAINDSETTVLFYDDTNPERDAAPGKPQKPAAAKSMPATPPNLAAAQKQLKAKQQPSEDEPYVYLPPGSSMRDPGYNSMSDPLLERKVYHRDPVPSTKKE